MNQWQLLRWLWTALYASTALYVSIPDYPYGTPLWSWLTLDQNGYLHEMFYITVFWLLGLYLIDRREDRDDDRRRRRPVVPARYLRKVLARTDDTVRAP